MSGEAAAAAVCLLLAAAAAAGAPDEATTLLTFRSSLHGPQGTPPDPLSQWVTTPGPCSSSTSTAITSLWYGVTCHPITGKVRGLRLEYLALQGPSPSLSPLASLSGLRALSLANNNLTGKFPDVSMLPALKMLYLSRNNLAGDIPAEAFGHMRGLRKLYLSDNAFTGRIPSSITSPRLLVLQVEKNRFDGGLPDFNQESLRVVDFSDNNLSGPVPAGLRRFDAKAFQGNKDLCGPPLAAACPNEPLLTSPSPSLPPSSSSSPRSLKVLMIIAIVVVIVGALLAAAGVFTAALARRRYSTTTTTTTTLPSNTDAGARMKSTPNPSITITHEDEQHHATAAATAVAPAAKRGGRRDDGKLVFVQEGRERFELEDLLRASAEVLGSGNFGASYKATPMEGQAMVVKRFKEMKGVGREDFNEHMRRLGRLSHPNLLPVVAYLYRREEKLIGVARGLAHLYDELPMLTVPHGHLKSSNVLLDAAFQPILSDYALVPVVTPHHAAQVMVAYKSPECGETGRPSKKSDVWSLGILILEVLTGKFPANYLRQGRGSATDLAGWVNSVVREEWTGEVFDKDMRGTRAGEGEMVKLLKVGLGCCESDVDRRWDLREAVTRIEELRERSGDGGAGDDNSDGEAVARHGGETASHSQESS
uniref:Protein kinase domain-containing protein n=1 Tax=Leersia perrieri TaxID=77586 RepID=A0A0D9WSX3_9ORYZ